MVYMPEIINSKDVKVEFTINDPSGFWKDAMNKAVNDANGDKIGTIIGIDFGTYGKDDFAVTFTAKIDNSSIFHKLWNGVLYPRINFEDEYTSRFVMFDEAAFFETKPLMKVERRYVKNLQEWEKYEEQFAQGFDDVQHGIKPTKEETDKALNDVKYHDWVDELKKWQDGKESKLMMVEK